MVIFNCCYAKNANIKNINDEIEDVVIDSKQRYYYYYTCIPFHEVSNRLRCFLNVRRTQNMIHIYMNNLPEEIKENIGITIKYCITM